MNHEEYKELLALEALGALEADEREALVAHLATCAECRAELAELRDASALIAYAAAPVAPGAELRARVLDSVRGEGKGSAREPRRGGAPPNGGEPGKVLPLTPKKPATESFAGRTSSFGFGAIAAGLVIASLVAALAVLWRRNSETRAELARTADSLRASQAEQVRLAEILNQAPPRPEATPSVMPSVTPSPSPAAPTPPPDGGGRDAELRAEIARAAGRGRELQAEIARLAARGNELQNELAQFSTRDNERQAEITRLTNLNRETQTQLEALTNRNRELQAEVTRLASRNNELQTQVARFTNQTKELQAEVARLTRRSSDLQNELARQREAEPIVTTPDARVVSLAGTSVAPGARGRLIYDRRGGNVAFDAYNLPPAPPGRAYQLWLIADGKPQSAGVFTTGEGGRAALRGQIPRGGRRASAFAVTLEPAGGSPAPTGDKVLVGSS